MENQIAKLNNMVFKITRQPSLGFDVCFLKTFVQGTVFGDAIPEDSVVHISFT